MVEKITGKLLSIQVGKPAVYTTDGQVWESGISKQSVFGEVFLTKLNLEGDGQADLINHGGSDKAVCVYSAEHVPYWEEVMARTLGPASFGENMTVTGLTEEHVCIGDTFQIGDAVVQISQPRQPCHKLAKKHEIADLPQLVQNNGFTGYYFRVLKEGHVHPDNDIILLERPSPKLTVEYANRIMHHEKDNQEGIRLLLDSFALSESWRSSLEKRLTTNH